VDLSPCRPGARGYGKARITFAPAGTVQLVEITSPLQGPPPDSACVSAAYGKASVPPFAGRSVPVTTTFFVR
jgi:hypothetical protein